MSRYTIELREIENCICYLFPKGFPFYTDSEEMRLNFIQKFYDEYMFREIGFETVERFKRSLLGKLNKIMPYYTQLYHTELESKNINFLLNKDLIETFEREVSGSSEVNSNSTTNATNNVTNNATVDGSETSTSNSNDMMYDTPNSRIDDLTKYPTQGSQGNNNHSTSSNTETNSTSSGNSNSTSTNNQTGENTQTEKTSLVSKGNIGVTSSAQLLKECREVIINIDELILNDLEDLFMLLF